MADFSKSLSSERERRGLSREELAARASLNPSHIYRLETGARRPSRETVLALADALEVDNATLELWLAKVGYAPLDLAVNFRPVVRVRGATLRSGRNVGPASSLDTATVARQLEAIGLKESTVRRLVEALASSGLATQRRVSTALSSTFSRALAVVDCPVRTAVIPAAGGQHRLLAPDLMQRLLVSSIREAADCGIIDVVLVLAPGTADTLYSTIRNAMNIAAGPMLHLTYCEQGKPDGLGDAVLRAEEAVGTEPFAVLLPDDTALQGLGRKVQALLGQMIAVSQQYQGSHLLAVTSVPRTKMAHCGVVKVQTAAEQQVAARILHLAEKPSPTDQHISADRDLLGIVGRYILQPSVFGPLRSLRAQGRRPVELTDALEQIRREGGDLWACELKGNRHDVGELVSRTGRMIEEWEEYNLKRGETYVKRD